MNPSPLPFRIRILVLAILAIAWIAATRDSPREVDVHPEAITPATSQVVVAGKANDDRDGR